MLKLTSFDENTKKGNTTQYILSDSYAFDGAQLIPIECGGRLITAPISVNDLGKQLLKAATEGNVDEAKSLLSKGALFTADWLGTSPLHFAARNNHLEVCEILLRAGISKDARTKVDKTSLHMAAYEGHIQIVEALLEYGADPDCRDLLGMTPLHWAAQNGHVDIVNALLKYNAQTDPINKFDLTPADLAVQMNRLDIVETINMKATEPVSATEHLTLQLTPDNSEEYTLQSSEHMSPNTSDSPIPLETILMEDNDNSIDTEGLHLNISDENNESDGEIKQNENTNTFMESMKLLQEHGITMLPNDDSNILSTVMESGHSVVLTEVGKEVLKSLKESERNEAQKLNASLARKRIITVTPEEFLAMTNVTGNKTNVLKQINGRLVPRNIKRIVMKKNKIIPISSANIQKSIHKNYATDMETVMTQLIEARKTIEEYKVKLMKKEEEAERYKQQLKFLMDES